MDPLSDDAFKFATLVVLAIVNGAVPVVKVLVIIPVAETVVNAAEDAVVLPILPGLPNVAPLSDDAFKFATFVDDATTKGAVPVLVNDVICPVTFNVLPRYTDLAIPSPPEMITEPVLLLTESVVLTIEVIPATFKTFPTYNDLAIERPPRVVIDPVEIDTESVVTLTETVVKTADDGDVDPIDPGLANVAPLNDDAFKFATLVVLLMVKGAVPVLILLVITLLAEMVVKAPLDAVVFPIDPGLLKVAPPNVDAFKLAT